MDVYTVIVKRETELVTHVFASLEIAIELFPQIVAWKEFWWEMQLPQGMNIGNWLNVKKCFIY